MFDDFEPAYQKPVHWFDRQRVFGSPGDVMRARAGTSVDGKEVECDGWAVFAEHTLVCEIQARDFGPIELGVCKPAELPEIDVGFFMRVMAGNEAGEHAGVGSRVIFGNEGQAHPGKRIHAEHFQDRDVRVPAAEEDEVFAHGRIGMVHLEALKIEIEELPIVLDGFWRDRKQLFRS